MARTKQHVVSRNRIVLALELGEHGRPAMEVAEILQEVAETGDWYLARDPSLQLQELLVAGDVTVRKQAAGYAAHLAASPPIVGDGNTVEEALFDAYDQAREQGALG